MWTLGLAGSHNGAVALLNDQHVVVAVQIERVTRKRDGCSLSAVSVGAVRAIQYCLDTAGIQWDEISCLATCTPWQDIHLNMSPDLLDLLGGRRWPELSAYRITSRMLNMFFATSTVRNAWY